MIQKSSKLIAKNTILLYFRMIVTMVITLYTSRVILQILGVDDYGIYKAVGGTVGFLAFLNNALATASSRFLTYGMGEGDNEKLRKIFSTTLTAHVVIALIIIIAAETVGLWFLNNKLIIPAERYDAALYTFHISILTAFFALTQIPYNATIIAHERMNVFAYVSIVDAILRLLIVYALAVGHVDKLKLYAILLCLLQVGIMTFYRIYCSRSFAEARFKFCFDKGIFREIAGFSGWSLLSNCSLALNNQGILILLNMFFSPAVVTARAISVQVNMAAHHFVSNFQTAANPQIVKRYAAQDYDGSKNLLLQTTRYSYYLMLMLSLPIVFVAEPLLHLWLGIVPDYTVIFLQIVIIQSLFQVFDTSFYRALYAKGQLKENALITPAIMFSVFPLTYYMFKNGYSPVAFSWATLCAYIILGLIVKPMLIIRIVDYKWSDMLSVFKPCLIVTLVSVPLPLIANLFLHDKNWLMSFVLMTVISVVSVFCTTWFLGIDKSLRTKIAVSLKKKVGISQW